MKYLQAPRLTALDGSQRDLRVCFRLDPPHFGEEIVGFDRAFAVWNRLAGTSAFHLALFELDQQSGGGRIVAFGARLFVSRDFVESELATPRPGLQGRIIQSVESRQPVILNDFQIRHANTHDGLNAVIIVGFDYRILTGELYYH